MNTSTNTALTARIEALREDLETATGADRAEALDHLEEVVLLLEAKGDTAPRWARAALAAKLDEDVETQFDNMPV